LPIITRPTAPQPNPPRPGPGSRLVYAIIGLALAVLLIGAGASLWLSGGEQGGGVAFGVGGPFTLQDGNGHTVTDRDFRGRYMLVYFGYTNCPDVCPTTLTAVADALDRLGPKAALIAPLFVTVDPRRDTVAVVKQYAGAFGPNFVGLTGTPEQIAVIAKEYRVYYAEHKTGPGPDDYAMDHSSVLYLMDTKGVFIAPIRADMSGDEMAANLRKLLG
jgi:protein SCO1/2